MIISDAMILITLINIDELRILKLFIDEIIIPPEVYDKVSQQHNAKNHIDAQVAQGFISIESYESSSLFNEINYILDRGESASIALAIERKGRRFAQNQGIEIIGLVGILWFLYTEKRLSREETLTIIQKLNDSDFRIGSKLLNLILG